MLGLRKKSLSKTTRVIVLAFMVSSLTLIFPLRSGTGQDDHSRRVLYVGVYENRPMVFVDEEGNPRGVYIDIIEDIAGKEGWTLEYVPGTWQQCLARLQQGELDILVDIAYSEARDETMDFTEENVFATWARIYIQPDSEIRSIPDLQGKKIAVLREDIHYPPMKKLLDDFDINVTFREFNDYFAVFEDLSRKRSDAALICRIAGMMHEHKYNVQRSPIVLDPIKIHFAFPEYGNAEIKEAIDRHLKKQKADPESTLHRSMTRWLGGGRGPWFPGWMKWLLGGAAGLLLLLTVNSIFLRSQVRAKTREILTKNVRLEHEATQRKRAATALRESEQRHRTVINNAMDAVVVMDSAGEIMGWNEQASQTFGWSKAEAIEKSASDMVSKDANGNKIEWNKLITSSLENPIRMEAVARRKSGEEFPAEISISSARLGHSLIVSVFMRDISGVREAEKDREKLIAVEHELSVARSIQESILPSGFPHFPDRSDFDIYAEMIPAREVGGDFYDFFMIDKNRIGIVIGDVSGKGVPAAILMAASRTMLRAAALQKMTPEDCLEYVNRLLYESTAAHMFVSAFYGILNVETGEFRYSNAGHNPPYIVKDDSTVVLLNTESGIALAAWEESRYVSSSEVLSPGDTLVLYTDGVPEAMDPDREMFGTSGLMDSLKQDAGAAPREIIGNIIKRLHRFTRGAPQNDDITLLALRYAGKEDPDFNRIAAAASMKGAAETSSRFPDRE